MKELSEIREPHIRYFPRHAERPRRVEVSIRFFPGTGSHFHAEIREEPNYVWDHDTETWIAPEDDSEGEGRLRFMKFNREDTARRWVEEVFSSELDDGSHELVFRGDVTRTWFYPEGD
jgi:hypothetical protein